jgi:hypothetical protein
MGTSYETMLVAADFTATLEAVRDVAGAAIVVPVAAGRVAVVPRENEDGVAPVHALAERLSAVLRRPVLAVDVVDSDFVQYVVYRDGDVVHEYVSDEASTVEMFEDDDGEFRPMIGSVVYPVGHVVPDGPVGADAEAFSSFAVGRPDLDRIGAALRGEVDPGDAPHLMAERQHRAIIAAFGLSPAPLGGGYRHLGRATFPGAVVVEGVTRGHDF